MNQREIKFVTISTEELADMMKDVVRDAVGEMFERQSEYQQGLIREEEAMLTQEQLTKLTGYGRTWIRNLEKRGVLKNYKRKGTNRNLFKKSEVLDLINRGVITPKVKV